MVLVDALTDKELTSSGIVKNKINEREDRLVLFNNEVLENLDILHYVFISSSSKFKIYLPKYRAFFHPNYVH